MYDTTDVSTNQVYCNENSPSLSKQRPVIVDELRGHILRLVVHHEAGRVIADIYELYTNAYERAVLVRNFYGEEVALFEGGTGTKNVSKAGKVLEVSEEEKNKLKLGLAGILEGAEEEKKKRILAAVKENVDVVSVFLQLQSY